MRTESRIITGLAALALVPAFILPLWSIRLVAPQYREGLGMFIGLRDIWGHRPHDIQNINILNHYIGMKPIVPAEVDVLTIMPWVVLALIIAGLAIATIGRRSLLVGWLVLFVALGASGLREFQAWNYDYGHNLSPDAPIKVPGMTYQPPLFGTTQLLNIQASSYPSWGTLFIGLALLLGVLALWHELRPFRARRRNGERELPQPLRRRLPAAAIIAALLAIGACGAPASVPAPVAVDVPAFAPGGVASDYCDGVIPEERFGGELLTRDGRTYRFMSTECLAGFVIEERVAPGAIRSIRVVDYNHGERLIDVTDALFVRSQFRPSPNGLNLLATDSEKIAANLHRFFGGQRLGWDEVLALVRLEWSL